MGVVNAVETIQNMNKYPFEKLEPYLGQYVAWRTDGTEIIAGDPDLGVLIEKLKGVDPETYILDSIPALEEVVGPDELPPEPNA